MVIIIQLSSEILPELNVSCEDFHSMVVCSYVVCDLSIAQVLVDRQKVRTPYPLNSVFFYKKNVPRTITYFSKHFEHIKIVLSERYTKIELVCT